MAPTASSTNYSSTGQIRLRSLLRAIRNSNIAVFYQTPDLCYAWAENVPAFWQLCWQAGISEQDLMPRPIAEKLMLAKARLLQNGEAQRLEIAFTEKNNPRWYEFFIDLDKDENGAIIGIVTTAVEISELKHREQVLKILLREVSHRSKNLLAVIQSIAAQTARYSGSVDQFLHKFRGRLYSLSHSQDLVTDSNWHGAAFHDLLNAQLQKYIHLKDERLKIEGENVYLFPGAALHIGLALHELIVNSASYGALACNHGNLTISARLGTNNKGETDLVICWKELSPTAEIPRLQPQKISEKNNHGSKAGAAQHFGSAVLLRIVPQAVNGTASYDIHNGLVEYRLHIPYQHFDY